MDMKEAIKLVVTIHTSLPKLQTAVSQDDMNFDQMMQQARSMELASKEVAYMKNSGIASQSGEQQPDVMDINQLVKYSAQKGMPLTLKHSKDSCRYCGELIPHKGVCRARGATCNKWENETTLQKCAKQKNINNIITTQPTSQHTAMATAIYGKL